MPMKQPAHPGRLIKTALEDLNVPLLQAAEALGVTSQQLADVIDGHNGISPELALRLELGIGSTAETWIDMQRTYDLAKLRERAADIADHVKRLAPQHA